MSSPKLKLGSKGKLVAQLQKYLNLKGKIPKPVPENGEFGPETKDAVKYFQKKAGLKTELDGTVGPETAGALAKLVGATASSFGKEFGELQDQDKAEEKGKEAKNGGKPGKFGNVEYKSGGYVLSIPPDPAGTFPLVVLFAGITHIPPMYDGAAATPNYFKKAILAFSEQGGSFSGAMNELKPLLAQSQTKIGSISICGYSGGGPATFRDYSRATKGVGLIDPACSSSDLSKLDAKAVFSCNPDNWSPTKYASIIEAQKEAAKSTAGVYERTTISHEAYPKYFLDKFESKMI